MAPPVETNTRRGMPASRVASSRLRVPVTLMSASRPGSATEAATDVWAARWKIRSGANLATADARCSERMSI